MWEFFITKSKFTYLLIVALLGVGTYALVNIPRESSPEVVIPIGVVTTVLPGAAATDVENLITNEIERGLLGSLENVDSITSTSREGVSSVVVEFSTSADLDTSITDLKSQVDSIVPRLPSSAEEPTVTEVDFVNQPILTFTIAGTAAPETFLEVSSALQDEIEALPQIKEVTYSGIGEKELSVIVEQTALAQYELSVSDVIRAIGTANQAAPIGQIENDGILYNLTFSGTPNDIADIEAIAVTTRGNQPVYVRDVATVYDTITEPAAFSRVSQNGEPADSAISFNVFKQSGGDISAITKQVQERITELQADGELLANYDVLSVLDLGKQNNDDLVRLVSSGAQTIFLVMFILVIALGWREALVAGLAIPLSFLFGFIGLFYSDNTINFLSSFALILGVGILVDSGIVMVEGINRRLKDAPDADKQTAARAAVRDFAAPLIAGTLTTVSMFAGLFIVSGVTGQFIKSIPFTLVFVLFASLFVALAILPVIASSLLRRRSATKLEQKQYAYTQVLESWYRQKLEFYLSDIRAQQIFLALIAAGLVGALFLMYDLFAGIIAAGLIFITYRWRYQFMAKLSSTGWRKRLIASCLWIATTATSVALAILITSPLPTVQPVQVIFFEQGDLNYVFVDVELTEGSTKSVTDLSVRQIEEALYQAPYIDSFVTTVGSGNQFSGGGSGEKLASIFVLLRDDRELTSTEIVTDLRSRTADITGSTITVSQPNNGPPVGSPVGVSFTGDNLDDLVALANQTEVLLNGMDNVTNIDSSVDASTEFNITLDIAKAAAFGLNAQTVSNTLRSAVFGAEATVLTSLTTEVPVQVQLNLTNQPISSRSEANQVTIDTIRALTIPTNNGEAVPLDAIASITLQESRTVINHEEGERVVTVSADVTGDANVRTVQTDLVDAINNDLTVPAGVTVVSGGEGGESDQAFVEIFLALIVGIVLMISVLVLQFNSYLHTSYVLSILPFSLIGIMSGLALMQSALSFPSIMGFIALSGIVVNNSILLIDVMNQDRRRNPEKSIQAVVIDGATNRIRPILLTTFTTVMGMVPLTYSDDLWAPLAYAVMFGLLFSVVITLVLIPIIYSRRPGTLG